MRIGVGVVAESGFSSGVWGRLSSSTEEPLPVERFRIPAAPGRPPAASVGASASKALAARGDNRVSVTLVRFFLGATTKDMGSVCSISPPGRLFSPNISADDEDVGDEGPARLTPLAAPPPPGKRGRSRTAGRPAASECCGC